jgi:hypothetical protein
MFGNVARALGEDFAPYLGHVVGLAFASCRQEDGAEIVGDDSSDSDGDEELGSDESSDDEGGGRRLNVRTGGLFGAPLFLQTAIGAGHTLVPHCLLLCSNGPIVFAGLWFSTLCCSLCHAA